ncbi:hypothetical protein ASPZODRAFT_1104445 [Penicilliopsis zonata CBS 506.65]|uniref:Uncharacterized protein n=1 Tax=Penicilliopsis zonata CBS 506.65 TaxID=1073090 RepID=A0A1L9SSJ6_9EURO|nr:hypothetical protein ASPZODRAFT_1104445 [Penicilliopsis zonata CBS 506.65]OJJ50103.1 hypothetical protein ASPZODRAFT_1104445 [Penicilliopsis zonata CBS 506.65]
MNNVVWCTPCLEKEHVPLIARLADAGFSFDISATYHSFRSNTRRNLQLILSNNDDELVKATESAKLIYREKAEELREALRQRQISPDEKIGGYLLLEMALGWTEGVRVLLEFGGDARHYFPFLLDHGVECHHSVALLLRAGCLLSKQQLNESVSCNDEGERMMLLVNEVAVRRKRLRTLAEAFLPSAMIPNFNEKTLLDGPDCAKVYDLLVARNIEVPCPFLLVAYSFSEYSFGNTVYHELYRKECAEALYNAGFHDTDLLDLEGHSPLGSLGQNCDFRRLDELTEIIIWHISKGDSCLFITRSITCFRPFIAYQRD